MTEYKTLMDETLEVEAWGNPEVGSSPLATTVAEVIGEPETEEPVTEVLGSPAPGLELMTEAASIPHLTRKLKGTEIFMAQSGIMMEREVFHVIPTTAMSYPNPEEHALGLTYGEAKPQGRLFSGPNRKARRVAEKQQKIKMNKISK